MGIEYCLFKPDTNERYELGKGHSWTKIFPESSLIKSKRFRVTQLFGSLPIILIEHYLLCHIAKDFHKDIELRFFNILAKDIVNWCGDDEIEFWTEDESFNEYYDPKTMTVEEFRNKYPYTGSRFNCRYE